MFSKMWNKSCLEKTRDKLSQGEHKHKWSRKLYRKQSSKYHTICVLQRQELCRRKTTWIKLTWDRQQGFKYHPPAKNLKTLEKLDLRNSTYFQNLWYFSSENSLSKNARKFGLFLNWGWSRGHGSKVRIWSWIFFFTLIFYT